MKDLQAGKLNSQAYKANSLAMTLNLKDIISTGWQNALSVLRATSHSLNKILISWKPVKFVLEHDFGEIQRFGDFRSVGSIGVVWMFRQTLASALMLHPQEIQSWILEVLEMLEIDKERLK